MVTLTALRELDKVIPYHPFSFAWLKNFLVGALPNNDEILKLMKENRGTFLSSNVLYVDDILIFCTGKLSSIHALTNLFTIYSQVFDQILNSIKFSIFSGLISTRGLST